MSEDVVTRFAPSPTGFLHIGGARTALFNWLYARGRGGKMLLRIEDTDRERSTRAAIDAILDGLSWLGIEWDGDVIYQFARAARHREVAEQLLAAGQAYRCYASQQELDEMREKARAEGRSKLYDGRWRDRDPAEAPAGVKPVIRLKAPLTGETAIEDEVQGRVVWQNENLDDLVLLRSDGTPTYMLAVVVDDHDMAVTHIIRGDDHLTNAARQTQIYNALGWTVPVMAHIPLIHGPDGSKLSKRHGALGVDAYRAMGYLPAALRNYLVRLGWSHGDQEIFSTAEMVAAFDLAAYRAVAGALRFRQAREPQRALHPPIERCRARRCDRAAAAASRQRRTRSRHKFTPEFKAQLAAAMPGLKERAKNLVELVESARFLYADRPIALDDKAKSAAQPRGLRDPRRIDEGSRRGRAVDGGGDRECRACLRRTQGGQARRGRPAAARRADGAADLAGNFRRAAGARQAGEPRPPRRPDPQRGLRPANGATSATPCSLFGRPCMATRQRFNNRQTVSCSAHSTAVASKSW